jgi:hypothetical protein
LLASVATAVTARAAFMASILNVITVSFKF